MAYTINTAVYQGVSVTTGSTILVAPVYLPSFAHVTKLSAYFYKGTASAADIVLELIEYSHSGVNYGVMAEVTSEGIDGEYAEREDTTINSPGTTGVCLVLQASCNDWANGVQTLVSAKIEYTLDQVPY